MQLDITLRDYDSGCTLSYIDKQCGENGGYMSVIFVFMHGVYEVNISKILAVTTLLLDDLCMKYVLSSPVQEAACR